jgi:hypothetical protein
MEDRHCRSCGKELAQDSSRDICNLCAIGLTPAEPLGQSEPARNEFVPEGRVLAGSYCPHCHAEMTLADLSRRSCSICGAPVVPEALRMPAGPLVAHPRVDTPIARDVRWPDDAPLW